MAVTISPLSVFDLFKFNILALWFRFHFLRRCAMWLLCMPLLVLLLLIHTLLHLLELSPESLNTAVGWNNKIHNHPVENVEQKNLCRKLKNIHHTSKLYNMY